MTKQQVIDDSSQNLSFESTQTFFNLIDLKPYTNDDGGVNPLTITKKIKNLTLNKMNDSIILTRGQEKNCEYYYKFDFENKEYKIPFCIPKENLNNFKYYEIKTDTINNYQRTISIWTNKNLENYSSVNLLPLDNESFNSELWIGISSKDKISISEVERILTSVRLKNN